MRVSGRSWSKVSGNTILMVPPAMDTKPRMMKGTAGPTLDCGRRRGLEKVKECVDGWNKRNVRGGVRERDEELTGKGGGLI